MYTNFQKLNKDIQDGKTKFSFFMSRPQSIQRDEIYYQLFEGYKDIAEPQIISTPLEGGNRALYIEAVFLQKVFEYLIEKISSRTSFMQHLAAYKKLSIDYIEAGKKFSSVQKNKKEILEAYTTFYDLVTRLSDFAWTPIALEKIIEPQLMKCLQQVRTDLFTAEEMYHVFGSPTRLNDFQKMRIDICNAVIDGTEPQIIATALVNAYYWHGEYSFREEICSEQFFIDEINKLTKEKAQEEKQRLELDIVHSVEQLRKVRSIITDEHTLLLGDIINEYTFLRTDRVDLLKKLQVPFRHVLELIVELLKEDTGKDWTRVALVEMMNGEIISYLTGEAVPDVEKVQSRNRVVFYKNPSYETLVDDQTVIDNMIQLLQAGGSQQIKGSVAFKGVVRGKVSIVFGKDDLHKITEGSVFVARTTMPDYIHAMEKAAAFVTEEGGITSHAAIIARELKKPCIVGTGNCTKVLKDGDMVEVDAEKGVVQILS